MSDSILTEIVCPNCQNPLDVRQHGQHITCDACSSQFILQGHMCPNCNAYHREERGFCHACGTALTRVCEKCGTVNWAGDEYCRQCGTALDIFALLKVQGEMATMNRLNEQSAQAKYFKEKELADSERRMQKFQQMEQERLHDLQQRRQAQRQNDQILLLMAGGLILLILAIVILLVLL